MMVCGKMLIGDSMKKMPIGILDEGVQGLCILENLTKNFKNEDFIYINDVKSYPYEGKDKEVVLKHVMVNVEKLLEYNIKLLIVISDVIIECCEEYFSTLKIPVINIVQSIADYVNTYYEQKNLILCARSYILKANIYQKNFKYNRMYNIESEELENVLISNMSKTSASFKAAENTFKPVNQKGCDLLIVTAPWLEMLRIEIFEFLEVDKMIKLDEVISEEIKKNNIIQYSRGRGKLLVISDVSIKNFKNITPWFSLKFKYIEIENEIGEKVGRQNSKI